MTVTHDLVTQFHAARSYIPPVGSKAGRWRDMRFIFYEAPINYEARYALWDMLDKGILSRTRENWKQAYRHQRVLRNIRRTGNRHAYESSDGLRDSDEQSEAEHNGRGDGRERGLRIPQLGNSV